MSEVLPPSNRDYDLETKRKLYARYGVVYWVVDPEAEEILIWDAIGARTYRKGDEAEASVLQSSASSSPLYSTPFGKLANFASAGDIAVERRHAQVALAALGGQNHPLRLNSAQLHGLQVGDNDDFLAGQFFRFIPLPNA